MKPVTATSKLTDTEKEELRLLEFNAATSCLTVEERRRYDELVNKASGM